MKLVYRINVNRNAKAVKLAMERVNALVLAQKVKSVAAPVKRLGAVMKQTLAAQLKVNAVLTAYVAQMDCLVWGMKQQVMLVVLLFVKLFAVISVMVNVQVLGCVAEVMHVVKLCTLTENKKWVGKAHGNVLMLNVIINTALKEEKEAR